MICKKFVWISSVRSTLWIWWNGFCPAAKSPCSAPFPAACFVRVTRHLRSAAQRLTMARLSENDRKHFAGLLQAALARCENRVRERFRPILTSALEDVGLGPRNVLERTALLKLTEELLDRILEYGFLTFSDVRDALARNQLKLPDLSDPQDFIGGDPLLRLDRRLATMLDGVYRRGEIYLRLLERCTALNFGTLLGRLVTTFVTIPFLSAFVLTQVLNHWVLKPLYPEGVEQLPLYVLLPLWGLLGVFLLGLLHSTRFRERCGEVGRGLWRPLKRVLVDVPLWVVRRHRPAAGFGVLVLPASLLVCGQTAGFVHPALVFSAGDARQLAADDDCFSGGELHRQLPARTGRGRDDQSCRGAFL